MIQFKSCTWKNFLSTGNDPIAINLEKAPTKATAQLDPQRVSSNNII